MAEIIADPSSLPAPEVIFPEPPKPFSKETFTEAFEGASASLKSSQVKYTLSEEDKKALTGFNSKGYSISEVLAEETITEIPKTIF